MIDNLILLLDNCDQVTIRREHSLNAYILRASTGDKSVEFAMSFRAVKEDAEAEFDHASYHAGKMMIEANTAAEKRE